MRLSFVLNLLLFLVSTLVHKAWAQVTAPSRGGDVSIVQVNATSMVLKVGTTGTGQGRIVAIATTKAGTSVPMVPADNQFYTGSPIFSLGSQLGSGYVVYNGSEHAVTVSGLQPSTYYYVSTAEYNTNGNAIAYNRRSTNMIISTSKATVVDPTPLPVQLVAFTGTVDANSFASFTCVTASEYNSNYFALERSTDGNSFSEVTRVVGAGSSGHSLTYKFFDPQSLTSNTYYRLRQVDRDASLNYSNTIILQPALSIYQSLDLYPNPGTTEAIKMTIQGYHGETFTLRLMDALGRQVFSKTIDTLAAAYQAPLGLPTSLVAGTYLCTIQSGSVILHKRIEIHL